MAVEQSQGKMDPDALKKYLTENQLSVTEFAQLAKVSRGTIYNFFNGTPLHPESACRIEKATKGVLSYSQLTSIPLSQRIKRAKSRRKK